MLLHCEREEEGLLPRSIVSQSCTTGLCTTHHYHYGLEGFQKFESSYPTPLFTWFVSPHLVVQSMSWAEGIVSVWQWGREVRNYY